MPGHGPAPKLPGERRRYNQPTRSEWVELKPLEQAVLPRYRSQWQVSRHMWQAWRADPVTSQYGEADVALCVYLAEAFHDLSDPSRLALVDRLALSPKGRRDLRLRLPAEVETIAQQPAPVKRLKLMEKEGRDGEAA